MAIEYPLTIDTETGLSWVFKYRDKATGESRIPAGSTASMKFRDTASMVPSVEITTESGHIVLMPITGRVEVTIPRGEAAALQFRQANYRFYLNRPDGTRKKLWWGVVKKV